MCKCIATVNKKLAEHNTQIEVPIIGPNRPFVATVKINYMKRGRPKMMFATYCPFCGKKYPEPRGNPHMVFATAKG